MKHKLPDALTRSPRPRKSWKSRRDSQCHLVYCMERWIIGPVLMTRTDRDMLQAVIEHACRAARVRQLPKLRFFRKYRKGAKNNRYGYCTDEGIYLNTHKDSCGANLAVLLHELAHWIVDHYAGFYVREPEDHGEEFVTVYRWLLDKYRVCPAEGFDVICDRENVRKLALDETPSVFQVPVRR